MSSGPQVLTNGLFFAGSDLNEGTQYDTIVIQNSQIVHVGSASDEQVRVAKHHHDAQVVDLEKRVVLPGFIDAHVHILFFGLSLKKLDLEWCNSLEEIRITVSQYAKDNPELSRVLCRGWQQSSTNGEALASALDDLDSRPIFIEALDLHSSWCNSAALKELPIDTIKSVCPEFLTCDEAGNPTGLVAETAVTEFVWAHLVQCCTPAEIQDALGAAFEAYLAAGYTGIIEMAADKLLWDALIEYRKKHDGLPLHIAAHWFHPYHADEATRRARLDEALEIHRQWHPSKDPQFCVVGLKLISDGVVDGCTAALNRPYGVNPQLVHPIWPAESMAATVKEVVDAGMQCAIHAIGNAAITQSIDSIAAANSPHGRHRIEHLETATAEDAKRLGQIGITASVQPIHSDPARLIGYAKLLGDEGWARAFPYREFLDGNACVAIGSDAPTASHLPLLNLYSATTRKSVTQPDYPGRTNPSGALTMVSAVTAATYGAAYSRFAEYWVGTIAKGMQADLVVLDCPFQAERLLNAKIEQTWIKGRKVYEVPSQDTETP